MQPVLACCDARKLADILQSRWSERQVASLLQSNHLDARKIAALAVGLVGGRRSLDQLLPLLRDDDPMVHQMAEHAIWSVWFRCGSVAANHDVCRGAKAMNRRDYDHAIEHFTCAIQADPTFAEAYNQRAIVHFLMERYDRAIEDCRRAVERMPCHFGAWSGMGHCHAHDGDLTEAIRCYEQALAINPHLEGVRQAVTELQAQLSDEGEPMDDDLR